MIPVDAFEIETELAEVFRLEAPDLQLYRDEAVQSAMEEKEIDGEVAAAYLKGIF